MTDQLLRAQQLLLWKLRGKEHAKQPTKNIKKSLQVTERCLHSDDTSRSHITTTKKNQIMMVCLFVSVVMIKQYPRQYPCRELALTHARRSMDHLSNTSQSAAICATVLATQPLTIFWSRSLYQPMFRSIIRGEVTNLNINLFLRLLLEEATGNLLAIGATKRHLRRLVAPGMYSQSIQTLEMTLISYISIVSRFKTIS